MKIIYSPEQIISFLIKTRSNLIFKNCVFLTEMELHIPGYEIKIDRENPHGKTLGHGSYGYTVVVTKGRIYGELRRNFLYIAKFVERIFSKKEVK